jgi:hypothetical protein
VGQCSLCRRGVDHVADDETVRRLKRVEKKFAASQAPAAAASNSASMGSDGKAQDAAAAAAAALRELDAVKRDFQLLDGLKPAYTCVPRGGAVRTLCGSCASMPCHGAPHYAMPWGAAVVTRDSSGLSFVAWPAVVCLLLNSPGESFCVNMLQQPTHALLANTPHRRRLCQLEEVNIPDKETALKGAREVRYTAC